MALFICSVRGMWGVFRLFSFFKAVILKGQFFSFVKVIKENENRKREMGERIQVALNVNFSAPVAPSPSDCNGGAGESVKHSDPFSLSIPLPPLVDLQAIGPLPKISLSNLSTHSPYGEVPSNGSFHLCIPEPGIPKIVSPSSSFVGIEFSYPPSPPPCVPYVDPMNDSASNEESHRDGMYPTETSQCNASQAEPDQQDDLKSKKSRRSKFHLSQWSKSVRFAKQPAVSPVNSVSPVIVNTKNVPSPPPPINLHQYQADQQQQQQQQQSGKTPRVTASPTLASPVPNVSASPSSNIQWHPGVMPSPTSSSTTPSPRVPRQASKGSLVIGSENSDNSSPGSTCSSSISDSPRSQGSVSSGKASPSVCAQPSPRQPSLGDRSAPSSPTNPVNNPVSCGSEDGGMQPSMRIPRNFSTACLDFKRTQNYLVGHGIGNSYSPNQSHKSEDDEYSTAYDAAVSTTKQQAPVLPQFLMNKKHTLLPPHITVMKKQQK